VEGLTSTAVLVTVASSVLSALGTGGIMVAWLRYRVARERLEVIEGPAADLARVESANAMLMRQLESQEERHREDRREYRDEVNGLRDTVSRMGARMDAMRELVDERDATIDAMRREHDRELREVHAECDGLRAELAAARAQIAELEARYLASPKRATDRSATVIVADADAAAAAAAAAVDRRRPHD
jgi:predicted RNase H-like nuclease (RuvC/YqgF family)